MKAIKILLDNPVKLFFGNSLLLLLHLKNFLLIVPGLLIGAVEVSLRWKFPTSFNLILDLCNDFNFMLVFLLGFGIAAADDHGMKEVVRKGRWYYLVSGNF